MGRALVQSHLGGGKYAILYRPDNTYASARAAELNTLKTALDTQYAGPDGLLSAQAAAQEIYQAASTAFVEAIEAWSECARQLPPCTEADVLAQQTRARGKARAEAATALSGVNAAIAQNRASHYAATRELIYLSETAHVNSTGVAMEAWGIDYNPAILIPNGTTVGTIETFGAKSSASGTWLPDKHVNLQTSLAPTYAADRDHCVKPVSSIPVASMAFFLLQWPYIMSRNPLHAVGTIKAKHNTDCAAIMAGETPLLDVELHGYTPSSGQPSGYPFTGEGTSLLLTDVPAEYLACGADVFELGDQVIVRFSDVNRANPTVIGFAQSPRECPGCAGLYNWPCSGLAVQAANPADMDLTIASGQVITIPGAGSMRGDTRLVSSLGKQAILNARYVGVNTWLYCSTSGRVFELYTVGAAAKGSQARRFALSGTPEDWVAVTSGALPPGAVLQDFSPDLGKALYTITVTSVQEGVTKRQYQLYEATITDSGTPGSVVISSAFIGDYGVGSRTIEYTRGYWHNLNRDEFGYECWETQGPFYVIIGAHVIDVECIAFLPRYTPDGTISCLETMLTNDFTASTTYEGYHCDDASAASSNTTVHTQTISLALDSVEVFSETCSLTNTRERTCNPGSYSAERLIVYDDLSVLSAQYIDGSVECPIFGLTDCDINPPIFEYYPEGWHEHYVGGATGIIETYDSSCVLDEVDNHPEYNSLGIMHPITSDHSETPWKYQFGVYDLRQDASYKAIRTIDIVELSNNLIAVRKSDWPNRTATYGPFITPSGISTHDDVTLPIGEDYAIVGTIYGTRNPETDELSTGTTPRCWF